jgi:uncharacterized membrane protein
MTFKTIVENLISILKLTVPILIGLAVVMFLYGLFVYVVNSGDESKRKEGVQYIIYGLVGLFVMIAMWALAGILSNFFGTGFAVPQIAI